MLQSAFGPSCMNRASVFEWHKRFKEGRESWGMMKGVAGVRKSIYQSWLAKGLGLLCWGFKGVQEKIPSEEASTLQIESVAFPAVHNSILVTDYLTKMGLKTVPHPYFSPDLALCDFWLFPKLRGCRYETIRRWKKLWRRSLIRSNKRASMGPSRSCWNGTTSALQPEEITSKGTRVLYVYYQ